MATIIDTTGTIIPVGIVLDGPHQEQGSAFGSERYDITRADGRSVGEAIRHQFKGGHMWEVLAGYRSTDPIDLRGAVLTAVAMRDRWDGIDY